MSVHTRHRRCAGLPAEQQIVGSHSVWSVPIMLALCFVLVVVGVEAGASPPLASNGAFALRVEPVPVSPLSGINPLANGEIK